MTFTNESVITKWSVPAERKIAANNHFITILKMYIIRLKSNASTDS